VRRLRSAPHSLTRSLPVLIIFRRPQQSERARRSPAPAPTPALSAASRLLMEYFISHCLSASGWATYSRDETPSARCIPICSDPCNFCCAIVIAARVCHLISDLQHLRFLRCMCIHFSPIAALYSRCALATIFDISQALLKDRRRVISITALADYIQKACSTFIFQI
jgi:hypothetical protein